MAIIRQAMFYGQQRVDAAHLRAVESGVAGDFDVLAGKIISGTRPLIVSGFNVITTNAYGAPATSLQITTAGSLVIHYLASESGSIFSVPSDRTVETLSSSNTRIQGGFTANSTNYVGIDLRRSSDSSTADVVQFINTVTETETPQRVALARTLDYVFVISTSDFSSLSGICPIAKVVTNSTNSVTSIVDARNMFGRLGTGGTVPDSQYAYPWPGSRTTEDADGFSDGDKSITSLKEWMDATMTRLWELGGGEYWYSPTADRNVQMVRAGATFTNGEWFEWVTGDLHWKGISFVFDNSLGAHYNDVADQTSDSPDLTDLTTGQCIYVDLDRTTDRTGVTALVPVKTVLLTLGTPVVPGSRYIIAWNLGGTIYTRDSSFPVGATFSVATTTSLGIVKLSSAPADAANPYVPSLDSNGQFTNTATGAASAGWVGVGFGTGSGVKGTGGTTNGAGLEGIGGVTNGHGAKGTAVGIGVGVLGNAAGAGAFTAAGTSYGVVGLGIGAIQTGSAYGAGVVGVGPGGSGTVPSGFAGVYGKGGANGVGVHGVGDAGAGGIGVKGEGGTDGGDFTPGSTGSAAVIHQVSGNNAPQLVVMDFAGNPHGAFDHNGYTLGRRSELRAEWLAPVNEGASTTSNPLTYERTWSSVTTANASIIQQDPSDSTYQAMALEITPGTANGNYAVINTYRYGWFPSTKMVLVMEYELYINGTNVSWFHGLSSTQDPVAVNQNIVRFEKKTGADTTWWAVTCNTATGTLNRVDCATLGPGVATPSASVYQRFRIEYHGVDTAYGVAAVEGVGANTAKARFFIDEVRVATIGASMPTGVMAPMFGAKCTGASSSVGRVGPVLVSWNRYLGIYDM